MRLTGLLIVLAVVPVAGQAQFEYGHKIGSTLVYLTEPADAAQGSTTAILANLQLQFAELTASGIRAAVDRSSIVPPGRSIEPCVAFETWAEQTSSDYAESAATGVGEIVRTEGRMVLQRTIRDSLRQIYASYTVTMEKLPEQGTYRVSFGPPATPPDMPGKDWKVLSPAKYPAPQIMRDEDSIRIELYSNNTPGNATRRVVDYVHAGRQDRMVFRKETPHDSYAEDSELSVSQPRLRVNGVAGGALANLPETIRGPVLWVYVPGHGRFVLSLHARTDWGFDDSDGVSGEAAGNTLTFNAPDGSVFRIDTTERVAPGSGTYAVHVLPDLGWEPADPQDRARVMIGAAPGLAAAGAR